MRKQNVDGRDRTDTATRSSDVPPLEFAVPVKLPTGPGGSGGPALSCKKQRLFLRSFPPARDPAWSWKKQR